MNEVETRNQNCNSKGIGVLVENGAAANPALFTLQNSNVHDASDTDILTCSDQFPTTLTATVKGNDVSTAPLGISTQCNAGGTVTGNVVHGATSIGIYAISNAPISGNTVNDSTYGIWVGSGGLAVSGNTVNNASYGITLDGPGNVTSNKVFNSSNSGIYLRNNGATVKSNTVVKSPVAIEFNCFIGTVTSNLINGATTGLDQVPAAFNGANKFFNVGTVRAGGGC